MENSVSRLSEIENIVAQQRKFFRTGETLDVKWRIRQLKKLKAAVIAHEVEFEQALPHTRARGGRPRHTGGGTPSRGR